MRPQTFLMISAIQLFSFSALSHAATVDVTAHGARPDGKTLNTAALQRVIDATSASGGGTLTFPAGRYLTGTLILRGNITLHLETGATLLASPNLDDYPPQERQYREGIIEIDGKHQGGYPMRHLIYAFDAENIAIEGRGTIDGNGDSYFSADKTTAHARPTPLIELINCRQVRIDNITIRNAPGWTIHPKNCDDVRIRGVSILNHLRAINSDGIDIDSTRNVIISDCRIEAGDDCIVLKTTKSLAGETLPVENVTVTNCVLMSAATALKLGTESHGDYRHILFNNCVIRDSRTGLALYCRDGGVMQDIRFDNITMTTKPKWGKGFELPIVVELSKREAASLLGAIRDVSFNNIQIHTKGRVIIRGFDENTPVENISLNRVSINYTGAEQYKNIGKSTGPMAKFDSKKGVNYYAVPAGIICAHVAGLRIDGIDASYSKPEYAPAFTQFLYQDGVRAPRLGDITAPFER
ncbi:glycoside hydrolase family 28 protein [Ereboglobus luteus]|uniref:Rhamnogalacturonase A/B/Epimerase-like pectate lyase domain-containing protein n=1 Tax=Ereboglobus luteus TaxID=1796921 RepID=A0A2U8E5B0_9BACT|nr:glycoside hydrolase family 28 protein [Ereboglobus luteus]AWI09712.1 hypothetical protein CKA38_11015 [Ereboglobus luteus]